MPARIPLVSQVVFDAGIGDIRMEATGGHARKRTVEGRNQI
jgi:hypothetical protein